jgi:hypothetical protein
VDAEIAEAALPQQQVVQAGAALGDFRAELGQVAIGLEMEGLAGRGGAVGELEGDAGAWFRSAVGFSLGKK